MKKILILSSMVSLLILGCGSGGNSDDSDDKQSIDEALKIGDVAYSTPSGINFGNKMRTTLNKTHRAYKSSFSNFKPTVEACSLFGTMSYEESQTDKTVIFNECTNFNNDTYLYEYYNGSLTVNENGNKKGIVAKNYWYIPNASIPNTGTFMNLSINTNENGTISEMDIDGVMTEFNNGYISESMKFDNFTMKENNTNNSIYIKGRYTYKAGCINESHKYNTTAWLISSTTNDDIISGTIIIDNRTYIYNAPNVTVKDGNREATFNQSDLRAEVENKKSSTECGSTMMNME